MLEILGRQPIFKKAFLQRAKQVRGDGNMDFRPSKMDCISVTLDAINLAAKWNCVDILLTSITMTCGDGICKEQLTQRIGLKVL